MHNDLPSKQEAVTVGRTNPQTHALSESGPESIVIHKDTICKERTYLHL